MKTSIRLALAAITFSFATAATAQQELGSAYFMEGSLFRHELNPAFEGQQSYFSLLPLGHLGLGLKSNLGMSNLLYNRGGKTVTYLHPDVSVTEALSNIKNNNRMVFNFKMGLVNVGFSGIGGFNTIGINVRSFFGLHLPYDLFDLTKNLQNRNYQIGNTGVQAQGFVELALGHSHRIDEHWRVGGKLKVLIGGGRANAELDDLKLNLLSTNNWSATAHATVEANVKGLQVKTKQEEYNNADERAAQGLSRTYNTLDDFDVKNPGIGGWGLGLDLGTEYDFADIVPGLKASIAFLDLAFIKWNESHIIENNGQTFNFNGFNNIQVKDGNGTKFKDQTNDLKDRFMNLYDLQNKGNTGSSTHGIGATMNIGVEYALPMYDKLRFGLLSSTHIHGDYSWNEERLSVNFAPCNFFEMNINGAVGSFGTSFGWMLNLHPVGFNLFLGMDHLLGKVSKQFIPLSSNVDFTMGVSFPLTQAKKQPQKPKLKADVELPEIIPSQVP